MARLALALALALLMASPAAAQIPPRPRSQPYLALQKQLARGWNTWSTHSLLEHVLLPEGLAVRLSLKPTYLGAQYLATALRGNQRPEKLKAGLRTDDGRYTSLELAYAGVEMTVESATEGDDLLLLVRARTPSDRMPHLVVEGGLRWNRPGTVVREGDRLIAGVGGRTVTIATTSATVADANLPVMGPYLAVPLAGPDAGRQRTPEPVSGAAPDRAHAVAVYTGRARTLAEIEAAVARARAAAVRAAARWGDLAEAFRAMQTVLAWNVIYDAENDRVISPVSRVWNVNFGGYVLFDWDTYFAAAMYGLFDKPLAYANAVEITKSLTPGGFVPNFANAYGMASFDRSQPPVGSRVVLDLYRRHKERWLLAEVYDELLTWNRWWPGHRGNGEWLSWGTDLDGGDEARAVQFAKFESGLDNAPMFDGVPLGRSPRVFALADVGLTSLYVMDCDALAEIATTLGKSADAAELRGRADRYRKALGKLWSEERGIYADRRTDTGAASPRLAPTHFYPLLARAPTQKQAERMIAQHYFNPAEMHGAFVLPSIARNDPAFKDNNYWRGRIWAPMNYLVYLGLRNYRLPAARKDLVERSRALLLQSWRAEGAVYENYNATTGAGGDVRNADSFYHWGALLGFISFLERE
jgi:hypothetical protein